MIIIIFPLAVLCALVSIKCKTVNIQRGMFQTSVKSLLKIKLTQNIKVVFVILKL